MLPGKTLTPEEILAILRQRAWVIAVPLAVAAALAALTATILPKRYRSETLILVVPQRIPESYVKSTVSAKIEDRLQSISQEILSRTRLERIIQDFDLQASKRHAGKIMEDIVADTRDDISVAVVKGDAFRVSYVGDDPRTVMQVTDRLASLFIEENLQDRKVLANGTNEFLEAQLESARGRLIDHEKKLEAYRKRFSGELPTQLASNLQAVQNVQVQLQSLTESINRDRDRRLLIERELQNVRRENQRDGLLAPSRADTVSAALPAPGTASQQLATARAALADMQLSMTADHPDVKRMRRRLEELVAEVEAGDAVAVREPGLTRMPASPRPTGRDERSSALSAELDQIDRQLTSKDAEEKRLRALADSYQQRIERVPTRESELAELTRDYSTLQTSYTTLLSKQEESRIAANLESRQIGEQFKLLDPARLPERPVSPRRTMFAAAGALGGLALGLGLVALLEYRVRYFRSEHELASQLSLPVLAVVSLMRSDAERSKVLRHRRIVGCSLGGLVASCVGAVVYVLLG